MNTTCSRKVFIKTVLASALISLQVAALPIKIQPLGDSITYGPGLVPCVAYRYPLFKLMVNAGIDFQYVGTLIDGATYAAVNGKTMSPQHEGHWGYTISQINGELPGYLTSYNPDWSLVFLGNNNMRDGTSAATTYGQMSTTIDLLRAKNPNVVIFLGLLYQTTGLAPSYDTQITNLAHAKSTAQSPVILVGPPVGWDNNTDTDGGTHPNAAGADKLAGAFFQAIQTYRGASGIAPRQTAAGETPRPVHVTRSGNAFSVRLPVQSAHVDVVDLGGKLLLSRETTNGSLVLELNSVPGKLMMMRVRGAGFNTTLPIN